MSDKSKKKTPAKAPPRKKVEKKKVEEPKEVKEKTPQEIAALVYADLQTNADLVNKTATTKEMRHMYRALRYTFSRCRRKMTLSMLHKLIEAYYPDSSQGKTQLLGLLPQAPVSMDVEPTTTSTSTTSATVTTTTSTSTTANTTTASTTPTPTPQPPPPPPKPTTITPELEVHLWLLSVVHLLDSKQPLQTSLKAVDLLMDKLGDSYGRTMDPLSAKVYFYYSRVYELNGKLADIRVNLLKLQRTTTLRHNYDAQVVLLNLLLRNYLHFNLYEQADKLANKTELKTDKAPTNELARYHYYLGRINAVQLSYSEAHRNLQQALRRGPRDTACGFRASVTQFLVIVQLLLGEIPERSMFRTAGISHALKPYLQLTQAVRSGDVSQYIQCVSKFEATFKKDHTLSLVQRLHQNVIKTGLKKINLSYSRISFKDICDRLHLESPLDAEFIVAKAIRDGIIDAKINPSGKYIQSQENIDVYTTNEPERAFHQRIEFCNQIHNDAVKAMRYAPSAPKKVVPETEKKEDEKVQDDVDVEDLLDDDV